MSWWLASFTRSGAMRYISHLDTTRVVQRTFARAGIDLALTHGMRPKPRLSLPLPLPTGAIGAAELAVVEVTEETAAAALDARLQALRAAAADGLTFTALAVSDERPRPRAVAASYECRLPAPHQAVEAAIRWFEAEAEVPVTRVSPKGRKVIATKEYVRELSASPWGDAAKLAFTLRLLPQGTARVDEVVAALAPRLGLEPVVLDLTRTRIAWTGLPPGLDAAAEMSLPPGSFPWRPR